MNNGKSNGNSEFPSRLQISIIPDQNVLVKETQEILKEKKAEIDAFSRDFLMALESLSLEEISRAVETSEEEELYPLIFFLNSVRDSLSEKAREKLDKINSNFGHETEEQL